MTVELRKITQENKADFVVLCNSVDRKYLSDRLPHPYTDKDADWWIDMLSKNDGKEGVWRAVYADGKLVGQVSVEKDQKYRGDAEIGYFLATDFWSKGIMTQAARLICELAFEQLDIIRITGLYCEPNAASGRVLEKIGFKREGKKLNGFVKDGNVYNLCIMGLVRGE